MSHLPSWVALLSGLATLGAVFSRPLGRWYRKVHRRRGGVYLWRVDHHRNRARRVNGYVGETVSFYFRSRQHMGVSHYSEMGKSRLVTPIKVPAQPWSDLNPVMHKVIPLPWWLCWKWVLRPLETLVIWCTWPVYNDAKNRWNPRRITKNLAKAQRAAREQRAAAGLTYPVRVWTAHLFRRAVLLVLGLMAGTGLYGWLVIFR